MQDIGHEVFVANTFIIAKALLKIQTIDLIISDVHLENGGSVFDFLRWVKKAEHTAHIPFVLFSAQPSQMAKYLADGLRTSARLLGAVKYIEMDQFHSGQFQTQVDDLLPESKRPQKLAHEVNKESW